MNVLLRIFGQLNRYRGSAAIVFLLAASGTLLVLVVPGASRRIIDEAIPSGDASQILPLALIAIAAIVARQGLFTLRTLVNNSFEQRMAHDRRVQVYDKLQRLPMGWFDSKSTGDVLSRVSADVPAMQRVVLEGIDQGMTAILQIVIVVAYLFWLQPSLAGLMIVPIPIIFASIAWYTRRADPRATEASTAAGGVQSVLGDSLGGVRQIKVFAVEHKQLELFLRLVDAVANRGDVARKAQRRHLARRVPADRRLDGADDRVIRVMDHRRNDDARNVDRGAVVVGTVV